MKKASSALLTGLCVSIVLTACSDDDNGPTGPANVVGNYTLTSVNGLPLPYTVSQALGTVIRQGQMSLQLGDAYDLVLEVSDKNGDDTYLEPGSWGRFDVDSIFFVPERQGSTTYRGTVGNGILRAVTPDGLALQFQK